MSDTYMKYIYDKDMLGEIFEQKLFCLLGLTLVSLDPVIFPMHDYDVEYMNIQYQIVSFRLF